MNVGGRSLADSGLEANQVLNALRSGKGLTCVTIAILLFAVVNCNEQ